MDTSWIKNIITTENEATQVEDWICRIGLDRLKTIYDIAKNDAEQIEYYRLTECVKYDTRIALWIFKTIRVIEGHMRAMLLNYTNCYDTILSINEVEDELLQILSPNHADENIGILWKQIIKKLKRKKAKTFTIAEFLDTCAFSELGRFHSLLTDNEMYDTCVFKNRETKPRDLGIINQLRNAISHNHIVLNSTIDYKGEIFTLKQQIEILLSYIEDQEMRSRRIKELNGYATYDRNGTTMEIPEHYRIIIEE